MGNSVSDFKEGLVWGPRDRVQRDLTATAPSVYWTGSKPPPPYPLYGSGFASRCIDYNHPNFHKIVRLRRKPGMTNPKWNPDVGHPFAKESVALTMPSSMDVTVPYGASSQRGHFGMIAPTIAYRNAMENIARKDVFPTFPLGFGMSRQELWALGSTAVAKSIPDIPEFSLFRFIGELKAGLPKIPLMLLAKEKKLRNAGGEYLNVQFGILPLVSDLQNFIEALQNPALRSAVKHQLDKEFRVRKTIDKGVTSSTVIPTVLNMTTAQGLTGLSGRIDTNTKYRIWSSCSFAYHQVNMLDQLLAELDDILGGLGAVPTAIDVWNLLPWSWLVDWFANINHVITNLSYLGKDGLYLRRGYLMAHFEERTTSFSKGLCFGKPFTTYGVQTLDRKYRVRASPFGFGITYKELNPFQVSILGALGVSRMRL